MIPTNASIHRVVIGIWHLLTLVLLVAWFAQGRHNEGVHWIWIPLLGTPMVVLAVTYTPMPATRRSLFYWLLAAVSIPTAAAGLGSLAGWMFVVSIILLIWAARRENPSPEIVQM